MKIHTIPLNIGDLLGGTQDMDAAEFGAYCSLFMACYTVKDHRLDANDKAGLARIARCTPKVWSRVSVKVLKKFRQEGGFLYHDRVLLVVSKLERLSSKNRDNALKLNESKKPLRKPNASQNVDSSPEFGNANHKPEDRNKKPKKINYDEGFEEFWSGWPEKRRQEKPKAFSEWKEAKKKCPPEKLIEYEQAYLKTEEALEGFYPRPARWLKNERWLEVMGEKDGLAKPTLKLADIGEDTEENRDFFKILIRVRDSQGEAVFRSWISPLRVYEKKDEELTLLVPSRFMAEWIKTHFEDVLKSEIVQVWPEVKSMKFKIKTGG